MDIGARQRAGDLFALAEQQPAAFAGGGCPRLGEQCGNYAPCHRDFDRHFPAMSAGEVIRQAIIGAEGRLDKALADAAGASRERVKALIAEGRVSLAGRIARQPSLKVAAGTSVTIREPAPLPAEAGAEAIALVVVYEDADLIVIDKPAGLVVHPAAGHRAGTLVNALLHHCAGQLSGIGGVARPGIVHRIDKDTSGLIVAAKNDAAHEGLARQFAAHTLERAYLAVVEGHPRPADGTLAGTIGRSPVNRKKMALLADGRGKRAVTRYRTLERLSGPGAAALVECRLETGRTHQIRVHMASIGHGLLGDTLYGRRGGPFGKPLAGIGFTRQALHAATLGFTHPVSGRTLRFDSPLPADMRELLALFDADVVSGR